MVGDEFPLVALSIAAIAKVGSAAIQQNMDLPPA
jgi:hypothetical protein